MGIPRRTMNLMAIVFLLLSCVKIFQFFLAKMGWSQVNVGKPQVIVSWAGELGLSSYTLLFALMGCFLVLPVWLTGVAILMLTAPIYFPMALSLGSTLCIS